LEDIMRCIRLMIMLSSAVLLGGAEAVHSGGSKQFIDPNLDGWEGLKEYWDYKDGAVVGSSPKGAQVQHLPVQQKEVW
jgi:hypothetical protein